MNKRKILNPCVSVCRIDDNNMCEGCGRSLKEIREGQFIVTKDGAL